MGYWRVLHCPRGRASLGHRWEPTPCPSWGKNETPGSLSQAGREAGQTSEGARGLVAWVGLLSRKGKMGKKEGRGDWTSEGEDGARPTITLKPVLPQLTILMASMESRCATAHTPKARMVKLDHA